MKVKLTIDDKQVEINSGSSIIQAANKVNKYIPHFCYHKNLSIAANCRMCLVEVEKSQKPLPACATPVSEGMVVKTNSKLAKDAQKSVMEFLLINHPLDCPICDQGGECQLQDLSVGYGSFKSKYDENKRVVISKNISPLVSAEEMSRCIHCSRCVRFGSEIGGVKELGMAGRGETTEIINFIGNSIDSEMSGNMIDVCPVGALTSKPFRYSARTWELKRSLTHSFHDSWGSEMVLQHKDDKVYRIVSKNDNNTFENWITDRDRFAYLGYNSNDRIEKPLVKINNRLVEFGWNEAFAFIEKKLHTQKDRGIDVLVSKSSTNEELLYAKKLVEISGSDIDFRNTEMDYRNFSIGSPWFGMSLDEFNNLDTIIIVGSVLRHEQPLLAARIRYLKQIKKIKVLACKFFDYDDYIDYDSQIFVDHNTIYESLDALLSTLKNKNNSSFSEFSNLLLSGNKKGIFLGSLINNHPYKFNIVKKISEIASEINSKVGFFSEGANTVGAYNFGCLSENSNINTQSILNKKSSPLLLVNMELPNDIQNFDPNKFAELEKFIISISPFTQNISNYSDVILPATIYSENLGTKYNMFGELQKIIPYKKNSDIPHCFDILGKLIEIYDLEFSQSDFKKNVFSNRNALFPELRNNFNFNDLDNFTSNHKMNSFAFPVIYNSDSLVRRSSALKETKLSKEIALIRISKKFAENYNLKNGDFLDVIKNKTTIKLQCLIDKMIKGENFVLPLGNFNGAFFSATYDNIEVRKSKLNG
jgi:NADH-quinone oxidoreductase subunit G